MKFIIKLSLGSNGNEAVSLVLPPATDLGIVNKLNLISIDKNQDIKKYQFTSGYALFLGDPIFHDNDSRNLTDLLEKNDVGQVIRDVDGFYFLIIVSERGHKFIVSGSLFSILPVYVAEKGRILFVSSSLEMILSQMSSIRLSVDKQYYLEKALFNYPLFNRTPVREITVLPTNSHLEYSNGKYIVKKHLQITDYFTSTIKPWRKSLDDLSDLFIAKAQAFLPEDNFMATLTGGFDGRTVVGLALHQRKKFETYSYGSENDPDVSIPRNIAKRLGFHHHAVILDETYARNHFWPHAEQFVLKSNGQGNLSRAHYHYALEMELKNYRCLVTGNFGSEIIRTMKIAGVMASSLLFDMFAMKDQKIFQDKIRAYPGIRYLNPDSINNSIDSLLEEIRLYLAAQPENLTINKRFYIYMFEEVFRKYFGPEIMVQRYFIRNRSPYLCFSFIEELLKTEIAGANGDFIETNPFKRYHGQVLYAHVLKKTFPALLHIPLDRGYKPIDFLTFSGPLNIAFGYLKRNYIKKQDRSIPSYSTNTNKINLNRYNEINLNDSIFNREHIKLAIHEGWISDQMNFINMISAAYYHNWLTTKNDID